MVGEGDGVPTNTSPTAPLRDFHPGPTARGYFYSQDELLAHRGPLVRKTKRQGSSTGAANKQASSPTPLPPPRTRNFCAIAHEHDGVSGPAQCGHDATRGEAKASSAGWNTHCHTRTQSHTPRVRTPPRPRTIGNARSRSRSRKGGESARPILSPAGTPLRALTLLSEERSDGALSAYAPRSHARGRARTYCTVVG